MSFKICEKFYANNEEEKEEELPTMRDGSTIGVRSVKLGFLHHIITRFKNVCKHNSVVYDKSSNGRSVLEQLNFDKMINGAEFKPQLYADNNVL